MGRAFTGALLVLLLLAAPAAAELTSVELTVTQEDTQVTAASGAAPTRALVAVATSAGYRAASLERSEVLDDELQPIGETCPAAGQAVAMAGNPTGEKHLLVWAAGGQVRARRLTALGGPVVPEFFDVAPLACPSRRDAIAVANNDGTQEWLVVWSTGTEIEAQRVKHDGTPNGTVTELSDDLAHTANVAPHVTASSQGWIVVWQGTSGARTEIVSQGLDRDGGEREGERVITGGSSPSVAADPDGDAVIAFTDNNRVYTRRISPAGASYGENFEVSADARAPDIAWSPLGKRYLVVFRGESDRIRGRLLDAENKVVESTKQEDISTEGGGRDPSVVGLPSSTDFVVAWGTGERGFARWFEGLPTSAGTGTETESPYFDPYAPYDYGPYEPYPYDDTPYVYDPAPYELVPEPAPGTAGDAGSVGLSLLGTPTLRGLVGRGLLTRATCGSGCTVRLTLTVDARTARRHRVPATLARATRRLREGGAVTAPLRPRLTVRRRLRAVERLRVTVTLAVESADTGATERRRRSVTLTR